MRRFEIDLTARLLGHLLQALRPAEGGQRKNKADRGPKHGRKQDAAYPTVPKCSGFAVHS